MAETPRLVVFELQLHNPGAPTRRVTVRVGAAWEVPDAERDRAQLLRKANEVVYAAKQAGRSRVVSSWDAGAATAERWRDSSVGRV